jgi:hypothetical protein
VTSPTSLTSTLPGVAVSVSSAGIQQVGVGEAIRRNQMTANANCQTCKIRKLNDELRQTGKGGKILLTRALSDKGGAFVQATINAMRNFNAFTLENDPHGEHDFGQVIIGQDTVFWKIDYYDLTMEFASEDASDPAQTIRVLTLMLSCDY